MRAEDLSRGHWLVIAVLVGLGIGWLQGNWGESNATPTLSQEDFERDLLREPLKDQKTQKQYPWITAITVQPPVQAGFTVKTAAGKAYQPIVSVVAFSALHPAPNGQWQYKRDTFLARDPYTPAFGPNTNPVHLQDYLKTLAADRSWISYRYAWWHEPRWSYVIWVGGCVLVIGLVWPTVLNRLVLAGYGHRSEPDAKKESIWSRWFGASDKPTRADESMPGSSSTSSKGITQEDLDQIAKMEAGLKDFVATSPNPESQDRPAAAQPIQQIVSAPLESPKEEAKPQEKKDYDGEFYPTVAHAKKKHE